MSSGASDGANDPDHLVSGPFRRPYNDPTAAPGSIHDDRTAQELGFRAGTVAGAVHMEQFPPLLERVLGADWPRTGGLSLYFLRPTASGEPVRCLADDRPSGAHRQVRVWMEDERGEPICEGSASVAGTDPDSALRRRLATLRPPGDLRILAGVEVGRECAAIPVRVERKVVDARRQFVTEPLPGFDGTARGIELPISAAVDALRAVEKALVPLEEEFVGMFGAIELQYLNGPVFAETDYLASGRILSLAETPRSECVWYSSRLDSAQDGRPVAEMIMMSRLLKQSSSRWQA